MGSENQRLRQWKESMQQPKRLRPGWGWSRDMSGQGASSAAKSPALRWTSRQRVREPRQKRQMILGSFMVDTLRGEENAGRTRQLRRVLDAPGGGTFCQNTPVVLGGVLVAGLQTEADRALVVVVGLAAVYVGSVPDAEGERVTADIHARGIQSEYFVGYAGIRDGTTQEERGT